MNTSEIKRPSNLTEEDRAETTVLIEALKKSRMNWEKR